MTWTIRSPRDVASRMVGILGRLEREELHVLSLNAKNAVLDARCVYMGNVSASLVRVGELFTEPIRRLASGIVIVHNHPSGDPTPSADDLHLTAEARLRATDPVSDPATETRRLRGQMEADALADRYATRIEAQNHLLPEAWRLLNAGNIDKAQMYAAAARKRGAVDGTFDREVNRLLDATVPHRRQAVEVEVAAADELELSRRDVAKARLAYKIGTPIELVRASNTVQMAEYKRKQEAPVLKEQLGIDLPADD
jgi:hypothetical protein